MIVATLTHCRNLDLLYGSTLLFDTVRTGFPDARVLVFDTSPLLSASNYIRQRAGEIGAEYHQEPDIPECGLVAPPHWFWIDFTIKSANEPLVIVDPDVHFWEENRFPNDPDCLIAGAWIPPFHDEYTETVTAPRLHTSLLLIPDTQRLRSHWDGQVFSVGEWEPWRPTVVSIDSERVRYDTGAVLFNALDKKHVHRFTPADLSRYEYLFCGSNMDQVASRLDMADENTRALIEAHESVRMDGLPPRGLWMIQTAHFGARVAPWPYPG